MACVVGPCIMEEFRERLQKRLAKSVVDLGFEAAFDFDDKLLRRAHLGGVKWPSRGRVQQQRDTRVRALAPEFGEQHAIHDGFFLLEPVVKVLPVKCTDCPKVGCMDRTESQMSIATTVRSGSPTSGNSSALRRVQHPASALAHSSRIGSISTLESLIVVPMVGSVRGARLAGSIAMARPLTKDT